MCRGYTPAGVEAWNNIRALDYLETRPEVDRDRIGATGRSGGGAYSWSLMGLDDRIKVAVPVAGIVDLLDGSGNDLMIMAELDPTANMPLAPLEAARINKAMLQKLGYGFRG